MIASAVVVMVRRRADVSKLMLGFVANKCCRIMVMPVVVVVGMVVSRFDLQGPHGIFKFVHGLATKGPMAWFFIVVVLIVAMAVTGSAAVVHCECLGCQGLVMLRQKLNG